MPQASAESGYEHRAACIAWVRASSVVLQGYSVGVMAPLCPMRAGDGTQGDTGPCCERLETGNAIISNLACADSLIDFHLHITGRHGNQGR